VDFRIDLRKMGCALTTLCFGAGLSVVAAPISVTYSYTLSSITGDPANPPLIGTGSGSLLPLGDMAWSDRAFPGPAGAFDGTFTMTFANGTLIGKFHGLTDVTAPPNALPFTQVLNVTGGTGAFTWYNGTLTGNGVLNVLTRTESTSGSGTLNTTPEPASITLLPIGLLCLTAYRKRALRLRSRSGQAV
jgi:hypothetical protein